VHLADAEVHWPSLAGSRTPGRSGPSRWSWPPSRPTRPGT